MRGLHRTTTTTLGGLLLFTGALTGCGSAGSGTASGAAAPAANPAAASTTAPEPAPAASSKPDADPAPAGTACSMLPKADAERILGSPVTKTTAAKLGAGGALPKLDGCVYKTAVGTIGYDVLDVSQLPAPAVAALLKGHKPPAGGDITLFEPGISEDDTGWVLKVEARRVAFVYAVVGDRMVSVSASGASADAAQKATVEAATVLAG
ncbi:MAG: hypothetical protein HY830_20535 [Actinobacteria bacterium]|nr:hypothetical protein [Actinomycetota bacterium]